MHRVKVTNSVKQVNKDSRELTLQARATSMRSYPIGEVREKKTLNRLGIPN